ncbi:hypothetical protein ACSV5M_05590 [Cellvibrio sp. ARAG 10.3]|uniref:hypothetical protein n=1 Tax=Cellvibrio sp. ARAG 10.3 TaxID=3451358 RepID=UPI003F48C260
MQILNSIKEFIQANFYIKLAISLFLLILSIPLLKIFYWFYDASYLASFGIGPEIYSRPIFSSKLSNVWMFLSAFKPLKWAWAVFCCLLFLFIFFILFKKNRIIPSKKSNRTKRISENSNLYVFFESIEKAFTPAGITFVLGSVLLLTLILPIVFFIEEAQKHATNQINKYIDHSICIDSFDNTHLGCYKIPGEEGANKLIIHNDEKVLIYMSRVNKSDTDESEEEHDFYVHITNKVNGEKISRYFVRR